MLIELIEESHVSAQHACRDRIELNRCRRQSPGREAGRDQRDLMPAPLKAGGKIDGISLGAASGGVGVENDQGDAQGRAFLPLPVLRERAG